VPGGRGAKMVHREKIPGGEAAPCPPTSSAYGTDNDRSLLFLSLVK